MIDKKIREQIEEEAKASPDEEICGLVISDEKGASWKALKNVHAKPKSDFKISPEELVRIRQEGFEILAVVHTHPSSSAKPSGLDIRNCALSKIPWFIYSVRFNNWSEVLPESNVEKLIIGRPFEYNVTDCFSVVQDFYYLEYGIFLERAESDYGWWSKTTNKTNPLLDNLVGYGFEEIAERDMQKGDVLLMKFATQKAGHLAVFLGGGMILQHLDKRLANRYYYGGYWRRCVTKILRHKTRI